MNRAQLNAAADRDPSVRNKDFLEVSGGFDYETMLLEADRCLGCKTAPCMQGCPVSVRIPDFIRELKQGHVDEALGIIKTTNALPRVCGRVCPQENQCEARCVRAHSGGAVAIGTLERFVGDHGHVPSTTTSPSSGKRVAVVGSGPASLTCADELARHGVDVTVYEAFHEFGGVLTYGIPEFRLPKSIVKDEIQGLKSLGVHLEKNVVIGKTLTIEQLKNDFDAIFIGSGAGLPNFLGIEGEGLLNVISSNEFLTRVNLMKAYEKTSDTPVKIGKNVVVVGAGNVAMDSARTALRLGAESVTIVYRRTRNEVPARKEEVRHAEEEGVVFRFLTAPKKILGTTTVEGMLCEIMELGEPDAGGRRRPVPTGQEIIVDCDQVIVAVGTSPNPLIKSSEPSLATTRKGTIEADECGRTSIDGIYAGGDAVTGSATVILAMGSGKTAAKAILEKLGL